MTGHDSTVVILVALAALASVLALVTGKAARLASAVSVVLLAVALLLGWPTPADHDLEKLLRVLAGVLAVAGGGLVTTQVFSFVEDPDRVSRAGSVLRGGAWIGALERLGVYAALVAGWAPGVAVVLAVKGLGRYPELRNQEDTGVAERFIIGTFASVLWAVACAALTLPVPYR
jgi:hypothetical protein